jgi:VWFA-related protein
MTRQITATILAFLVPLSAQQPPAPAAPDGVVKFSTITQLVVETVIVKDKNGKPIEGLTAKDFIITEDGTPQTIQFCEFQKLDAPEGPDAAGAPAPVTPPPSNVTSVTRGQIKPEPPGDIRYRDKRMMAMYFDMASMPVPDQIRALSSATKFVRNQMKPADMMAVMQYTGASVKVLNDFTSDRMELLKSIDAMVVGDAQGFDENAADESAADTGTAFGQDDAEFNIFNTDRQLAALQTAVKMLGTLNEKKSLIYFASGMRLNGTNNQAQLQSTTNSAVRANVSIFAVDARGLVASAPLGDATVGSPGGQGMYTGGAATAMAANFQRSQDTLYALAADTGGKALLDYNDLSMGIVQAQQAITSYYIIGYYTTKPALDGKFRRVKITLAGDTTAKLDYRQGYYAGKTFNKFTVADKERQLEDALMLGDPMTELTIAMEVDYFQLNRAEYFVPVAMKIPGSELALARRGGAEHTVIDFIGEVKDEYGTTVSNVRDKVDIKLTGETAAELAKRPIQYDTGFTLLPGAYTIKVLARDDETGHIGTYINKFVIPNLNKEEKRVPISSVVLSSQLQDIRNALFTAKDKDKGLVANPLVQNGQKLLPNVTRVFSRSKDMYVYLQAYQPNATTAQPLVAFVTFYRGQTKAFETAPLPVSDAQANRLKTMPLKFVVSLGKLQPGRYNCQVTVLDPTGQKAAFWQAPIMLAP